MTLWFWSIEIYRWYNIFDATNVQINDVMVSAE